MPDEKPALLSGPAATILILLATLLGGVVTILDPAELSYEVYVAASMGAAGVLSIGRGMTAKGDVVGGPAASVIEWLETANVATLLVYLHAAVGAVVVVVGDALTWEQYMLIVFGGTALNGLGRGIAVLKKDRDPILRGNSDAGFQQHLSDAKASIPGEEGTSGMPPGMDPSRPQV